MVSRVRVVGSGVISSGDHGGGVRSKGHGWWNQLVRSGWIYESLVERVLGHSRVDGTLRQTVVVVSVGQGGGVTESEVVISVRRK